MAEHAKTDLKEQVALLPLSPGVYQFVDRSGKIIYVGKAKSLRKRVSSYFVQSREHSAKGARTGEADRRNPSHRRRQRNRRPAAGEFAHQDSAAALQHPAQGRQDLPLDRGAARALPRVQSTRQLVRDGSQYFGPYGSMMMQHSMLEFIREVVPLRTCKLNLAPESIARGKYSVCLQYHLGNCKGPCVGLQSEEDYGRQVELVTSILKGDLRPVRSYLEGEMPGPPKR